LIHGFAGGDVTGLARKSLPFALFDARIEPGLSDKIKI
jgi:hypothetical protein